MTRLLTVWFPEIPGASCLSAPLLLSPLDKACWLCIPVLAPRCPLSFYLTPQQKHCFFVEAKCLCGSQPCLVDLAFSLQEPPPSALSHYFRVNGSLGSGRDFTACRLLWEECISCGQPPGSLSTFWAPGVWHGPSHYPRECHFSFLKHNTYVSSPHRNLCFSNLLMGCIWKLMSITQSVWSSLAGSAPESSALCRAGHPGAATKGQSKRRAMLVQRRKMVNFVMGLRNWAQCNTV